MELPFGAEHCFPLLRRALQMRAVLKAWIEASISDLVALESDLEHELLSSFVPVPGLDSADYLYVATLPERLRRFKHSSFILQVDEYFSRTKASRDRLIYSLLRSSSSSRVSELCLAIREGEIDFATAAIRWSEGPESASGGRVGPIHPDSGHPEIVSRLAQAVPGVLIGPFLIGDTHVLLRLDKRINIRLDETLQSTLIEELYNHWLERQIDRLLAGETMEPIEYLPS